MRGPPHLEGSRGRSHCKRLAQAATLARWYVQLALALRLPADFTTGITALLVHGLSVAAHHDERLDDWPHIRLLIEEEWPCHLMTLQFRCNQELEEPAHIKDFTRLLGLDGDAFDQLPGT